jgi:rhodanese-related sulfurtransferase
VNEETSARAVLKLRELGYAKSYSLKGGWWEWVGAGYPVEKK